MDQCRKKRKGNRSENIQKRAPSSNRASRKKKQGKNKNQSAALMYLCNLFKRDLGIYLAQNYIEDPNSKTTWNDIVQKFFDSSTEVDDRIDEQALKSYLRSSSFEFFTDKYNKKNKKELEVLTFRRLHKKKDVEIEIPELNILKTFPNEARRNIDHDEERMSSLLKDSKFKSKDPLTTIDRNAKKNNEKTLPKTSESIRGRPSFLRDVPEFRPSKGCTQGNPKKIYKQIIQENLLCTGKTIKVE